MRTVVGVMGGSRVDEPVLEMARRVGGLIAEAGWILLNGGRDAGVMAASARGAADAGGVVVGVLPGDGWDAVAEGVQIPVLTGMGDARNQVNVLSSRVVIALQGGAGTISEVALALKAGRPVVTLGFPLGDAFAEFYRRGRIIDTAGPEEAVAIARWFLDTEGGSPSEAGPMPARSSAAGTADTSAAEEAPVTAQTRAGAREDPQVAPGMDGAPSR
jgi:uncharacterized protein (TIGR00725 family)